MTDKEKKENNQEEKAAPAEGKKEAVAQAPKSLYSERKRMQRRGGRFGKREEAPEEFEQKVIDIARVTRVMAGGKRMRFRACVAIGDKKGRVGIGLAKGADVTNAVSKAVNQAKKKVINVSIVNDTIPHEIYAKFGAAKILFKPAGKGKGVIAGGIVRLVLELAGIKNIISKILGTNNKVNNAKCVIFALGKLKETKGKKAEANGDKEQEKKNKEIKNEEVSKE